MSKGFGKELSLSLLSNAFGETMKELDVQYGINFPVHVFKDDQHYPFASSSKNTGGESKPPQSEKPLKTEINHEDLDIDPNFEKTLDPTIEALGGTFGGSNAFAISGNHTESGRAFILGDPHLPATLPSTWYQWSLTIKGNGTEEDRQWRGSSNALVPFFAIYQSDYIGSAITLGNIDTIDTYLVKLVSNPNSPDSDLYYERKGKPLKANRIREQIIVKGRTEPVELDIYETEFGLLVDDIFDLRVGENGVLPPTSQPDQSGKKNFALALKAVPLDKGVNHPRDMVRSYIGFSGHAMMAKNCHEYGETVKLVHSPVLNMMCADVENNIAHFVTGTAPYHPNVTSNLPTKSWNEENIWTAYLTPEQMPRQINPKKGYITSSNHKLVGDDYGCYLGSSWSQGYRAKRLDQLVAQAVQNGPVTFEAAKRIQNDLVSLAGLEFKERFFSYDIEDKICNPSSGNSLDKELLCDALNIFRNWDGSMDADSIGGTIYATVYHAALLETLNANIRSSYVPLALGQGYHPLLSGTTELVFGFPANFFRMLDAAGATPSENTKGMEPLSSEWIDKVRGPEALLISSFVKGTRWLGYYFLERTGNVDIHSWRWGVLHYSNFRHNFGAASQFMDSIFSVKFEGSGDSDTVAMSQISPHRFSFAQLGWVVSLRNAFEAGGKTESLLPPGNSGQIGSPFYSDVVELLNSNELLTFGVFPSNITSNVSLLPQV